MQIYRRWNNVSIRAKCGLMIGLTLLVMWTLVAMITMQLYTFSQQSSVIMEKYQDITEFMDLFSEENVALELFMRPSSGVSEREAYQEAILETDAVLRNLNPDIVFDSRREYTLKRSICNAMEYYRISQNALLKAREREDIVEKYLSLKTQAAYIDGYSRNLMHWRQVQGSRRWELISQGNVRSSRAFTIFMLLATVISVVVVVLFVRSILKPLSELGAAAGRIGEGQYDAPPLVVRSGDEIGRVASSFNWMQGKIRETIAAIERESEMEKHLLEKEIEAAQMQKALQEGRFAQLQSQINPHFLFNTLNTISAVAHEEKAPLAEELILRLSSFFRYSLENDERAISLAREMRLVRDYMELQETRYGDRIAMEIEPYPPAADAVSVPKFILQPLVENAIVHGMKERTANGRIRVRVCEHGNRLQIHVTDNGCGFDRKAPIRRTDHHSVGLDNIRERMLLAGGRLDVYSVPGLGTTVRITVEGGGDA